MKPTLSLAIFFAVVSLCPRIACAQSTPRSFSSEPAGASTSFYMEASYYEGTSRSLLARGNIFFLTGNKRMTATEARYDWHDRSAKLENASFTTCHCKNPDYHIEAQSITLLPNSRVRARRVSFFLGKTRVLSLPSVKMRIGGRRPATDILPRLSYDREGRLGLSQRLPLIDNDRSFATADVRFSSGNGFEVDFEGAVGIDGTLVPSPLPPLTYPAFRAGGLTIPMPVDSPSEPCDISETHSAQLRQYTRVSSHYRTYNPKNPNLLIFRKPEIGLDYMIRPIKMGRYCSDSRLSIYPLVNMSWGRFSEVEGAGPLNRRSMGFVLPVNVATSETSVIQPVVEFNQSSYTSGTTYTWGAFALGMSQLRPDGCLTSVRYINRSQRGVTPFQFDRLVVLDEVQAAVQFQRKRNILALVAGYDLGDRSVYDWSVLYGHRTDCLAASISWSNLERRVGFGVNILSR